MPKHPKRGSLEQRIEAIEDRLDRHGRAQRAAATSVTSGQFTVQGGALWLLDADGNVLLTIGRSWGDATTGMWIGREDGSILLEYDSARGFLGWYDKTGTYVITDDTVIGRGIARPYHHVSFGPPRQSDAYTTTSSSFAEIELGWALNTNPVLELDLHFGADAGTDGEVRLMVDGDKQVGRVMPIGPGWGEQWLYGEWPTWVNDFNVTRRVAIEARRVSGTGKVYVRVDSLQQLEGSWAGSGQSVG